MWTSSNKKKGTLGGSAIGAGIAIGVALGAAMDNVGAGIAIGLAIGVALDAKHRKRRSNTTQGHEHGSDNHTPPE
jgi:hypothetical protein